MATPRLLKSGMSEAEAIEGAKQGHVQCFQSLYVLHLLAGYLPVLVNKLEIRAS
jgi:hypothetical protein